MVVSGSGKMKVSANWSIKGKPEINAFAKTNAGYWYTKYSDTLNAHIQVKKNPTLDIFQLNGDGDHDKKVTLEFEDIHDLRKLIVDLQEIEKSFPLDNAPEPEKF